MADAAAAFGTKAAPRRHAVLRVSPQGFADALARLAVAPGPAVEDWARRGRPLMARRPGPCDVAWRAPAGLPLPPALGKRRIALSLDPGAVVSVEPPPKLEDCAGLAPKTWRTTIEAALAAGAAAGATPRCFGSLAWRALTGLPYLGAASDLDLIFCVDARTDVEALLARLDALASNAPTRVDGEVIRAETGCAANWRELADGAPEVLAKSVEGAVLMSRAAFLRRPAGAAA